MERRGRKQVGLIPLWLHDNIKCLSSRRTKTRKNEQVTIVIYSASYQAAKTEKEELGTAYPTVGMGLGEQTNECQLENVTTQSVMKNIRSSKFGHKNL